MDAVVGEPPSAMPPVSDRLAALSDRLLVAPHPVFVVLDGAHFEALPDALVVGGFAHRCLFLDRGGQGPEFEKNAPHLVWLDTLTDDLGGTDNSDNADAEAARAATLSALRELIGDRPAAVFWVCPAGGEALFKHLRTINVVNFPRDAMPADVQSRQGSDRYEKALFRHADANVMAQVMPCLGDEQRAKLLGPALSIHFVPDAAWALGETYAVERSEPSGTPPPSGLLTIEPSVMECVEKRRAAGTGGYLLDQFKEFQPVYGEQYRDVIGNAHRRADQYGMETLEDIELFVDTECRLGPEFEQREGFEEARYILAHSSKSATERIYYARKMCLGEAGSDP